MSLGFVFPGQGAQTVGMLSDLYEAHPSIRSLFEQAGEIIQEPLWQLVSEGPEERLHETDITQPAVLTAGVALWQIWQALGGPAPRVLSGHSLGEYTALVCAGALSFEAAARLVNLRGKYMQEAVADGDGAVAAVLGLEDAQVEACCADATGIVTPANYNAPGQVAIAGSRAAVEDAIERCKAAGAKRAVLLNVSVPVHCPLMEPAGEKLAAALDDSGLVMPAIPVVHNADGEIARDLDDLRAKLLRQLAQPVLWSRCVDRMHAEGVETLVECGPGKVLAGLIKRINRQLTVHNIDSAAGMTNALEALAG